MVQPPTGRMVSRIPRKCLPIPPLWVPTRQMFSGNTQPQWLRPDNFGRLVFRRCIREWPHRSRSCESEFDLLDWLVRNRTEIRPNHQSDFDSICAGPKVSLHVGDSSRFLTDRSKDVVRWYAARHEDNRWRGYLDRDQSRSY